MMEGQFFEHFLALRSERKQDFAAVFFGPLPMDVSPSLKPVDQFHRAVMLEMHAVGDVANPRPQSIRHAFDRKHQLILPSFEPRALNGLLAEMQEFTNLISELGQSLVVGQGELLHSLIVSCPDSTTSLYRATI